MPRAPETLATPLLNILTIAYPWNTIITVEIEKCQGTGIYYSKNGSKKIALHFSIVLSLFWYSRTNYIYKTINRIIIMFNKRRNDTSSFLMNFRNLYIIESALLSIEPAYPCSYVWIMQSKIKWYWTSIPFNKGAPIVVLLTWTNCIAAIFLEMLLYYSYFYIVVLKLCLLWWNQPTCEWQKCHCELFTLFIVQVIHMYLSTLTWVKGFDRKRNLWPT